MARRTRERYAEIRERLDAGQPQAAIRRATGLDRRTVQKYARADISEELIASISRESKLDEFKPYICQRWNQGLTDGCPDPRRAPAARLDRQPADRRRYATCSGRPARPSPPPRPCRKPTRSPAGCCPAPAASTTATRPGSPQWGSCPHLDALAGHIRDFAEHDHPPAGPARTRRLADPGRGRRPARTALTRRRHPARPKAVTAGLALPYSSGAMEGNVNKIKMIKRQMYGRAHRPPPQTRNLHPA